MSVLVVSIARCGWTRLVMSDLGGLGQSVATARNSLDGALRRCLSKDKTICVG
jgi:hypothetical protein